MIRRLTPVIAGISFMLLSSCTSLPVNKDGNGLVAIYTERSGNYIGSAPGLKELRIKAFDSAELVSTKSIYKDGLVLIELPEGRYRVGAYFDLSVSQNSYSDSNVRLEITNGSLQVFDEALIGEIKIYGKSYRPKLQWSEISATQKLEFAKDLANRRNADLWNFH